MHVVHLTDPSSSIGISMRYSLHRIIRSLFFWDEIVKQQRVTWITMNDLDTTAPVTTVERKRQQRFLRAWQKFPTAVVLKIKVLARCRLQLCCGIRFVREFQRLLPLGELILCSRFVLRFVCDDILRAKR